MRHPLIDASSTDGWVRLDIRTLELLAELAGSTGTELAERAERVASSPFGVSRQATEARREVQSMTTAAAYAEGVHDVLAWLAGHHSVDRLAELLDIDEDQR